MSEPDSYSERRASFLEAFKEKRLVEESVRIDLSPSGRYALETSGYTNGADTWNFSRGVVTEIVSGRILADIRRNYGHFWHAWVFRGEREEYLLCGEDYQGYNVIDLATAGNFVEFPEPGYQGDGFCWVAAHPSPDGKILAVEGCYWACPYELVFFDFSNPCMLPLPELSRADFYEVAEGWAGDGEFRYTVEDPACEGDPRPPILPAVWKRPA